MFEIQSKKFQCPVELTLNVLGGKWKILIIFRLLGGTMRYSEIKKCLGKVTHKMLSQQLRELEEDGVIERRVYPVVPPKVEYSLTANGKQLQTVIEAMQGWGLMYKKI